VNEGLSAFAVLSSFDEDNAVRIMRLEEFWTVAKSRVFLEAVFTILNNVCFFTERAFEKVILESEVPEAALDIVAQGNQVTDQLAAVRFLAVISSVFSKKAILKLLKSRDYFCKLYQGISDAEFNLKCEMMWFAVNVLGRMEKSDREVILSSFFLDLGFEIMASVSCVDLCEAILCVLMNAVEELEERMFWEMSGEERFRILEHLALEKNGDGEYETVISNATLLVEWIRNFAGDERS
jgi:hypothetical protein